MSIITGSGGDGGSLSSGNFGREEVVGGGGGVEKQELFENFHNGSNSLSSTTTSNGSTTQPLVVLDQQQPPLVKKKRNPPGNPDPTAEVIALSPNTLLAKNRFVCEICNKGFQRDQNLQLHRRGHNLPWKLRQRSPNEVIRKRVYICPDPSCVHHNPTRALGDLTGIKKHFCRKHGEKKWKCDKCSKKYAVQSDWKAHSKTCGTREYKCECGTIFSRRDSFITHRAFCDAIAEENNRTASLQRQISSNQISSQQPELISSILSSINDENDNTPTETTSDQFKHISEHMMIKNNPLTLDHHSMNNNNVAAGGLFSSRSNGLNNMIINSTSTTNISSSAPLSFDQQNGHHLGGGGGGFYLSATALLQKAAQMGTTTASSASSAMAPSSYATLDQFVKKDHVQEYQMSSSTTPTSTPPPLLPPHFFDVNGNSNSDNGNNKNVGIFSSLLFDHHHQNHAAGSATTFLKDMEQSMNNDDNTSNVVLHGGNSSSVTGGDVLTLDFLGIGRSASRQGNFHHEQKKQVIVNNNLRFGGINGHPNMQSTLTQFQQYAGLMEKHVWEV